MLKKYRFKWSVCEKGLQNEWDILLSKDWISKPLVPQSQLLIVECLVIVDSKDVKKTEKLICNRRCCTHIAKLWKGVWMKNFKNPENWVSESCYAPITLPLKKHLLLNFSNGLTDSARKTLQWTSIQLC